MRTKLHRFVSSEKADDYHIDEVVKSLNETWNPDDIVFTEADVRDFMRRSELFNDVEEKFVLIGDEIWREQAWHHKNWRRQLGRS